MKNKNNKGFIGALIIGIIAIVIAGVVAYVILQKTKTQTSEQPAKSEKVSVTKPVSEPEQSSEIVEWKTYRNEKYGFEVKYPGDWQTPVERGRGPLSLYAVEFNSNAKGEMSFSIKVSSRNEALNYKTVDRGIGLALNPAAAKKNFDIDNCKRPAKDVLVASGNYPAKLIDVLSGDKCFAKTHFYFLQRGDYDFFLSSRPSDNEDSQIKQILSTFKFID